MNHQPVHFEDGENGTDDQRRHQVPFEVITIGEDVQSKGDEVDGECGVDESVQDRPGPYQTTCFANENGYLAH
jgi:hypothetical protein